MHRARHLLQLCCSSNCYKHKYWETQTQIEIKTHSKSKYWMQVQYFSKLLQWQINIELWTLTMDKYSFTHCFFPSCGKIQNTNTKITSKNKYSVTPCLFVSCGRRWLHLSRSSGRRIFNATKFYFSTTATFLQFYVTISSLWSNNILKCYIKYDLRAARTEY